MFEQNAGKIGKGKPQTELSWIGPYEGLERKHSRMAACKSSALLTG